MMDDGIREIAGVKGRRADNMDDVVQLIVHEQTHRPLINIERPGCTVALTPDQARKLARQLHRLARRIERREQEA